MKATFNVEEVKIGEAKIENIQTEVIYTPSEFVETMKSLTDMFGKDIVSTIMKGAILGNMR